MMRAQIIIQGLVQGIGYRFFVVQQSRLYHLRGYVKNLSCGHVEVVAEGEKGMLNDFIEELKIGPPLAHITGINVQWGEEEAGFTDFNVRF